jgi:nitroreductase
MREPAGAEIARHTDHPIEPLIRNRWSPRAFDGSAMAPQELASIFEAARWAPSAFNAQPWRFVYAARGDADWERDWERLLGLLVPSNAGWASRAAVLVFILSDTLTDSASGGPPRPSRSHSFDAGAAWAMMTLQATSLGYQAHGMAGVDFERARVELEVPERFHIEAAVAIGRLGDKSLLPPELQAREAPGLRRPLGELVFRGRFGAA